MRNLLVSYRGGALSRGGLAFVDVCLQTTALRLGTSTGPPRPITFQFSNNEGYVLEFGDGYLRFVFMGGYIVETGVAITGVTNANPAQVSVAGTPFGNDDWIFISGVGGMTQLNGNTYIVAGVAAGHFTLQNLNGVGLNSTTYGAYTAGGLASRLYTLSTPYAAVDLPYLKVSQTANVMTLTCSNPETGTEYPPYELIRLAQADWTLQPCDFDPVISPPSFVGATANAQAPASGINATFAYQVTAVDADGNESIASVTATCHGADLQVEGGTNTVTWALVAGAKFYNVYRAPVSIDTPSGPQAPPVGSIFGFVGSAFGTQFADSNIVPNLSQTPPLHLNPFAEGQIEAVDITSGGEGLDAVTYAITTATGSGFAGVPVVIGGALAAFLITDHGENYQSGDSIAFNGAGFASGAIVFGATNPVAGDTVTLNGVVWTFVAAITGPNQTVIGGTVSITLHTLVADLSASPNTDLTVASYASNSGSTGLLITYNTAGAAGNAYTLAASRATPSGGTLTGGAGSGFGGTHAGGTMLFVNPSDGQNIVLNGVTWTFVTAGATGHQTNIGVDATATVAQLEIDLLASTTPAIAVATYSAVVATLDIIYGTVGAVGNTYTLSAGTAGATPSGPNLTGGSDAVAVPTATLVIGPESGTYPGVNAYFQQRRFFADSLNDPDTFWASRTGLYSNFDAAIPAIATDAITASPWTEQVNGVLWLIPMPGGLIAMTGLRAWQIVGEGSYQLNVQPITPSTVQAQPQAFNGCSATVQPQVIDYEVLYVQGIGDTTVYDLSWNFFASIYTGADLTILSSHLFLSRKITQWAWAREPYKVLWACCDDGTMISLTFLKEQQVYGWARHDTQGLVMGTCSVTEPPVNAIYGVVQRFPPYAAAGIYTMERMDNRIWSTVEDAYAVDSGVSNPMATPDAALRASAASGSGVTFLTSAAAFVAGDVGKYIRMAGGIAQIVTYTSTKGVTGTWVLAASNSAPGFPYAPSGAWTLAAAVTTLNAPHLAGMNVAGLADGVPFTTRVSNGGLITLPFAASNVKAGLPFTAQLQGAYLNGDGVVQGARKVIPAATFRLASSGNGFQTGTNQPDGAAQNPPQLAPTWTGLATANTLKSTGNQSPPTTYLNPAGVSVTQLWTGDLRVLGGGAGWNSKGQVAIQQTLPLALEVLSIEPEGLPGDLPEVTYKLSQGDRQQGPSRSMIS